MEMLGTRSKLSAIGLDIDPHEFRAVQLMGGDRGQSVVAWAVFPRKEVSEGIDAEPGGDELRWARGVLGRRGFLGSTVSIASATSDCSSHVIELPPPESGAPLAQLARLEIARARRANPEDFEVGFWSLPARGRTRETLAVACPRSVVEDSIERYESGGFEPSGIDLLELAIVRGGRAGGEALGAENEINAALHIGWSASLAVLSVGDTINYVRRVERGAACVWKHARDRYRLSVDGAERVLHAGEGRKDTQLEPLVKACWASVASELASELDVAVSYVSHAFRTAPLGQVRISGYAAGNPVVNERLDAVIGIPVTAACAPQLHRALGEHGEPKGLAARLTPAYGLAARFDK